MILPNNRELEKKLVQCALPYGLFPVRFAGIYKAFPPLYTVCRWPTVDSDSFSFLGIVCFVQCVGEWELGG